MKVEYHEDMWMLDLFGNAKTAEQMYENWLISSAFEEGMLNHKHVAPSSTYAAE